MKPIGLKLCSFLVLLVFCALVQSSEAKKESKLGVEHEKLMKSLTKDYNKDVRPYFGEGEPVKVNFSIFVRDILSVSTINQEFTVDLTIRQSWTDPRLQFEPFSNGKVPYLSFGESILGRIWSPMIFIQNSRSIKPAGSVSPYQPGALIRIFPDGRILYSTRVTLTAGCGMYLGDFPHDKHDCVIKLADCGHTADDVELNWASSYPVTINPTITLGGFAVANVTAAPRKETRTNTGVYHSMVVDLRLERNFDYYLKEIIVPAFLLVAISWITFWMAPSSAARLAVSISTLLLLALLTWNATNSMPQLPFYTSIHIYLFGCFVGLFLTLIEHASVESICAKEAKQKEYDIESKGFKDSGNRKWLKSDSIDKAARFVFPVAFVLFNVVFCIVY